MILVAEDGAVAGIVLYLAQHSPGLTIAEHSADRGPWPHAGSVYIQQFMETDTDSLMFFSPPPVPSCLKVLLSLALFV